MAGMHSDNYELARSSAPQSIKDYSAFTDKQWNSKADLSGGVYQAQNSLIELDLSNIYRSDGYSDVSDYYCVIPTCMIATCVTAAGATIAIPATTAGYALCTLKNNYQNLVHSVEMTLNGKTIHDHQSFVNVYSNFKMLSSMSPSDLKSNNTNFGMAADLDSNKSTRFSPTIPVTLTGGAGYGIMNNVPFDTSASVALTIKQNDGKGNPALLQRINRTVDTTANSSFNNLYGASRIMTADQLSSEYKPYYTTSGNFMVWYDFAVINLKYIVDAIAKIGLVKKAELKLKMYLNTGAVAVKVIDPALATVGYTTFNTTFANTCPITVNLLPVTVANGGIPATTDTIIAGLYISKPPSTFSGGGANTVPISGVSSNPLSQCLLYHSNIKLDNQSDTEYANANRAKKVIYEKILFANSLGIASGSQIDKIITSSIKNPIAVVIVPFVAKNTAGGGITPSALPFAQYESPYDTAPSTGAPLSITNISITLGGIKVANEVLNYTYENFLQQVSLAETVTSSDIGLNVGLVNQEYWESNRVYYVDLARSRDIDKTVSRELIVKGKNSSNVPIDCLIFAVYLEEFNIDVVSGVVTM